MSLADFKTIFFWEYTHRLLGPPDWCRLCRAARCGSGFAAALPRRLAPALLGILALGFAQGLLGWYMVESGLADRIEVSQYRLVAHLALALAIYSLILWTALGARIPVPFRPPSGNEGAASTPTLPPPPAGEGAREGGRAGFSRGRGGRRRAAEALVCLSG